MVRGKEKEIVGIWGQEGGWNSAIRGGGQVSWEERRYGKGKWLRIRGE